MRGTAVEQGLRHDWYVDERADPEKATWAAAKYLRRCTARSTGLAPRARLVQQRTGEGAARHEAQPEGRLLEIAAKGRRYLPRETREYVPMILAAIVIARNPVRYGLALQPAPPVATDRVRLPGPVDLRVIAQWTGTSVEALQELNPELRRWTTPPTTRSTRSRFRPAPAPRSKTSSPRWRLTISARSTGTWSRRGRH